MKATIATSSDWTAVYIDGRKVVDGHSIDPGHLLEALGYEVDHISVEENEWGEADYPENLANIKEAE